MGAPEAGIPSDWPGPEGSLMRLFLTLAAAVLFALGPSRPAQTEGRGWLYAAGELAMTAHDLALWDISLMERKLLKPESLD
jgi:D-alanyl-D-alanine carboxypeptidase